MGLESHITNVLDEKEYPRVYWFENGLHTERKIVAHEIAEILDESREFGPTKVKEDALGFRIDFGVFPGWNVK